MRGQKVLNFAAVRTCQKLRSCRSASVAAHATVASSVIWRFVAVVGGAIVGGGVGLGIVLLESGGTGCD